MLYMVTLTINIPQMLAYIPYMDPMGMVVFKLIALVYQRVGVTSVFLDGYLRIHQMEGIDTVFISPVNPEISAWLVVWLPFFIFPYIVNNHPNWLIFLRGVQTTNQLLFFVGMMMTINWNRGYEGYRKLLDKPRCVFCCVALLKCVAVCMVNVWHESA